MVMCSDSTLLEPCQGVTWKVKGWVFWGQDTGTKREARWKLCFGRRKSNECMYYSGITQYGGFLFFFFLNFIFYNFNFFFFCEKVEISYGRYETQVTGAGTVEETGSVKARKNQRWKQRCCRLFWKLPDRAHAILFICCFTNCGWIN